jgi:DNA-binding GntR family transcriptional regulator
VSVLTRRSRGTRSHRATVRRDKSEPLYEQLSAAIRDEIRTGALGRDEPLPSEAQLRKRFGVSRVTVRLALRDLRREGLVIARQGKGTFVRSGAIEHELGEFHTLTEVLAKHGYDRRAELIFHGEVDPPDAVTADLALREGERCILVKRRHFMDRTPIALTVMYLPGHVARDWSSAELEAKTVYELAAHHGLGRVQGHRVLTAAAAPAEVASTLGLSTGEPVMLVRSRSVLASDSPFESSALYFHPRRYAFRIAFGHGGAAPAVDAGYDF